MPEEQRVGQQKQHRSDLVQIRCSTFGGRRLFSEHSLGASRVASRPGAESTPVGADWRHVRIHGNVGVLDMHMELRWGVGHVALLVFVFQHLAEFDDLENASF